MNKARRLSPMIEVIKKERNSQMTGHKSHCISIMIISKDQRVDFHNNNGRVHTVLELLSRNDIEKTKKKH